MQLGKGAAPSLSVSEREYISSTICDCSSSLFLGTISRVTKGHTCQPSVTHMHKHKYMHAHTPSLEVSGKLVL